MNTIRMKYLRYGYPFFLLAFLVSLFFLNMYYLFLDKAPPMLDEKFHLFDALRRHQYLRAGDLKNFFFYNDAVYPPVLHWIGSIAFFSGINIINAVASEAIFWIILGVFLYKTGKMLWDERIGAASVVFTFTTPFWYHCSHEFLIDIPTASMAVMFIYLLLNSEFIQNWKYTLLAAASFGVGLLVKWQIISYTAGAALFIWGWSFYLVIKKERPWKPFAINTIAGLVLAGVISSVYYIPNLYHLPVTLGRLGTGYLDYGTTLGEYITLFVLYVMNIPYSLMILAGIISFIFFQEKTLEKKVIFYNFIIALFIQYFVWMKDPRYFLPMIPFASLLATSWIFEIRWKTLRYSIVGVFLLFAILHSFGWLISPRESLTIYTADIFANPPYKHDWRIEEIVKDFLRIGGTKNVSLIFTIDGDPPPKDIAPFYLYKQRFYDSKDPDFQRSDFNFEFYAESSLRINMYSDNPENFDKCYLVYIRKEPGDLYRVLEVLKNAGLPYKPGVIKFYKLPDDFVATLYRLDWRENQDRTRKVDFLRPMQENKDFNKLEIRN